MAKRKLRKKDISKLNNTIKNLGYFRDDVDWPLMNDVEYIGQIVKDVKAVGRMFGSLFNKLTKETKKET